MIGKSEAYDSFLVNSADEFLSALKLEAPDIFISEHDRNKLLINTGLP